ncbi:MAG: ABC transporter substrate-binding protein [Caldilineaceae bacterium]
MRRDPTISRRHFLKGSALLGVGALVAANGVACAPAAQAPAGAASGAGAAEAGGPSGSLTLALTLDVQSLDPIKTYSLNNGRWQKNVFGYLIKRDEEMKLVDGGGLALSWEQEDDMHIVFHLREGVTFHNGEPFNADAVVFSFDRLLNEENTSPQRFNYTSIDHFEKIDDYTVRMVMAELDPVIITKLAGYGAAIVPPKYVEEKGNDYVSATDIPGTGPYRIVEYEKDSHLKLEAYDGYWGDAPHIKEVTYRIIPDDATRLAEFLSGGVDVLTLTPAQSQSAEGQSDLKVIPVGVPTVSGLRLDASKPPTDNLKVREAIAYAIDTQTIIDTILNGVGERMAVWQSPYSFGYDPDLQPYAYDVEKAKAALAESGVSNPELVYNVIGDDTQAKEIANAVKAMLEAVGFTVTIAQKERATYFDDYRAGALDNVVPFGWGGWTLDADNTYYSMYYSHESYNPSFSDPEIDKLLEEQRGTLDQEKRHDIFLQVNKLIYDQYPDVMLYQSQYLWGVNDRVQNLPLPADERLWLAPASVTE